MDTPFKSWDDVHRAVMACTRPWRGDPFSEPVTERQCQVANLFLCLAASHVPGLPFPLFVNAAAREGVSGVSFYWEAARFRVYIAVCTELEFFGPAPLRVPEKVWVQVKRGDLRETGGPTLEREAYNLLRELAAAIAADHECFAGVK